MGLVSWDMPQTEEGLQEALRQLKECREAGDSVGVGNGLLALSHLVKWVRSDTEQTPFDRAHDLAMQAIEVFRECGDVKGQVRALVAGTAMIDRGARSAMLDEASRLAEAADDENCVAMVIAARARGMAMADREESARLHQEALEIYRRTGNGRGQARSLFALSISPGLSEEKRDFALEAANLYRATGDPAEAARCMTIAFMNAQEIQPLSELGDLARRGLEDALVAGEPSLEGIFYGKLALISVARGDQEEAERYRRWENDIKESDGLTELERWKQSIQMTRTIISMAKKQGNKETVEMFKAELQRLKAAKPGK